MYAQSQKIYKMVTIAFFTALVSILATITIPIGTVPFSMAIFGIFLMANMLPALDACVVVFLYLLLGMVGLPIFSNFSSGPQVLVGPTGGYLIGYLCLAFITAYFTKKCNRFFLKYIVMIIALLSCYLVGTVWLMVYTSSGIKTALLIGVLPFILPDLVKAFLALILANRIQKIMAKGGKHE